LREDRDIRRRLLADAFMRRDRQPSGQGWLRPSPVGPAIFGWNGRFAENGNGGKGDAVSADAYGLVDKFILESQAGKREVLQAFLEVGNRTSWQHVLYKPQ